MKWSSERAALALLIPLYVAARLWRLDASCLWFDEIFSVHAARHSWNGLLSFAAADLIHPPLFYALLKIWMLAGGQTLLWLRLFPALVACAAVAPFLLLARELKLRPSETNLTLLLMAANGYLIKYAQELRMYSLLLFFTLCSLWLFVKMCRTRDATRTVLSSLFVVNLLLVYTHYYGWLVVVAEAFILLLWRCERLRAFLLSIIALALCYVPWVYAVLNATRASRGFAQNIGWVARPGLSDVAQMLTLLHEPFYFRQSSDESSFIYWSAPLWFLLFVVPVALLCWKMARGRVGGARVAASDEESTHNDEDVNRHVEATASDAKKRTTDETALLYGLLVFAFLPLVLAFGASRVLPYSVWGTRHLIIIAPAYLALAAVAMLRLRQVWARRLCAALLGCWLLGGGLVLLARPAANNYIWCAWETLAGRVIENESVAVPDKSAATPRHSLASETVKIYAFEDLVAYHLWFALDTVGEKRFKVAVIKNVPGLTEDPAYFLPRGFDEVSVGDISTVNEDYFWIAFRDETLNEERPPLKNLKEKGYTLEKIFEQEAQGQIAFLALMRRRPS